VTDTFWLVRHGETEWSRIGRHTGRMDIDLTEAGCLQAVSVGVRLRVLVPAPALVLVSPLLRAQQTCAMAGYLESAETEPDLAEWNYGDYEGRTSAEIRVDRPGWNLWNDGVVGGETVNDVGRRADRVIERVRQVDGDVMAFAHGHLLRILAARWVGLPPVGGRVLALSPGSISALGYEREIPVLRSWNECAEQPGPA
jgi:broad specificity phosphatase PhoE